MFLMTLLFATEEQKDYGTFPDFEYSFDGGTNEYVVTAPNRFNYRIGRESVEKLLKRYEGIYKGEENLGRIFRADYLYNYFSNHRWQLFRENSSWCPEYFLIGGTVLCTIISGGSGALYWWLGKSYLGTLAVGSGIIDACLLCVDGQLGWRFYEALQTPEAFFNKYPRLLRENAELV